MKSFKFIAPGIIIFFLEFITIYSQPVELYRVYFKDKDNKQFNASNYFSTKTLVRRKKFQIPFDVHDIPVTPAYLDSLTSVDAKIISTSRWMNTAVIKPEKESTLERVKTFSFIIKIVKIADTLKQNEKKISKFYNNKSTSRLSYNPSTQLVINKGYYLHEKGYRGQNIVIAVIDAGFKNAKDCKALKNLFDEQRIIATKDFVYPFSGVYEASSHGTAVLSVMAANGYSGLWGSAPLANYILLRSEDVDAEYPAEEDFWVAAAEFADSVGADIINSSLGYTEYDNPAFSYTYSDLDGKTSFIAQAATIAASRGILVVVSAGNEGDKPWHYISTPSDARKILSVGSVNSNGVRSEFSSTGPTSDGRIKPEIMAMGEKVFAEYEPDNILQLNGTSFSAPLISGFLACLIEAFPNKNPDLIRKTIIQAASQYLSPDSLMGFGIPDFNIAFQWLQNENNIKNEITIFPNPSSQYLTLQWINPDREPIIIKCFTVKGFPVFSLYTTNTNEITLTNEIISLSPGVYLLQFILPHKNLIFKFIKL